MNYELRCRKKFEYDSPTCPSCEYQVNDNIEADGRMTVKDRVSCETVQANETVCPAGVDNITWYLVVQDPRRILEEYGRDQTTSWLSLDQEIVDRKQEGDQSIDARYKNGEILSLTLRMEKTDHHYSGKICKKIMSFWMRMLIMKMRVTATASIG